MNINWFPGHMFKTQKEIKAIVNLVDVVIEIRDARAIIATSNPDIETITKGKPRVIVLSKIDLADSKITNEWIEYYKEQDIICIPTDIVKNKNVKNIKTMIDFVMKDKLEKYRLKGVRNYTLRAMVLGIPNVGKSSLINKICNNSIAKVGNRPGVTKSKQWIKTKIGVDLLDTPGILWPKFDDEITALNLVYTGAIKDEILDIEEASYKLLEYLTKYYKDNIEKKYSIEVTEDTLVNLDKIGKKVGCLAKGSNIDYIRLAKILLCDYRSGKLGNISLEKPIDLKRNLGEKDGFK